MKVVRLYDLDDVRIEEWPVPAIGRREALVQVKACGICTSDTLPWYVRRKAPVVLGHEPAGVVAALGDEVREFSDLAVGDRVFVHHHAPCFSCRACERGHFSMCATWRASAIEPGGLAEFIRVPEVNLRGDTLRLPAGLTFEDGALIEPVACSVKAFRRARMRRGDVVVVVGLGVMGMVNLKLAKHHGAALAIGADLQPWRLQRALALGADHVIDVGHETLASGVTRLTAGAGADLVIVGPGTIAALEAGLTACGQGATLVIYTPVAPEERWPLSPYSLYFNEISLVPSYSCGPDDTREALELVAAGVIRAADIVTHRFDLEHAAEGFARMVAAGETLKAMIIMDVMDGN